MFIIKVYLMLGLLVISQVASAIGILPGNTQSNAFCTCKVSFDFMKLFQFDILTYLYLHDDFMVICSIACIPVY